MQEAYDVEIHGGNWLRHLRDPSPAVAVLLALVQRYPEEAGATWLAERTAWNVKDVRRALQKLVDLGLVIRVHRRAWVATGTAMEWLQGCLFAVDNFVDNAKLPRAFFEPVPPEAEGIRLKRSHVPLQAHDDHGDDHHREEEAGKMCVERSLVQRLRGIGFHRPARWLRGVDCGLVLAWLNWWQERPLEERAAFSNFAGYLRRQVDAGELPPVDATRNRLPPGYAIIGSRLTFVGVGTALDGRIEPEAGA